MSMLDQELINDFQDKEYAHDYMDEILNASIATQIKVLREQQEMTQEELAEKAGMQQARISVLENMNYSSWSINTLRKLARAFDLTLKVSFENFSTAIRDMHNLNRESLQRVPRHIELNQLNAITSLDTVDQLGLAMVNASCHFQTPQSSVLSQYSMLPHHDRMISPSPLKRGQDDHLLRAATHPKNESSLYALVGGKGA